MQAKILLTDGARTVQLAWLKHTGSDVYLGLSKLAWKRSYHASGKLHTTTGKGRSDEAIVQPLADLKGYHHLTTIAVGGSGWLTPVDSRYNFTGRKADVLLSVDLRSFPSGKQVNLFVGLLEPGNVAAILPLSLSRLSPGVPGTKVHQVMIATSISPWVVLAVAS